MKSLLDIPGLPEAVPGLKMVKFKEPFYNKADIMNSKSIMYAGDDDNERKKFKNIISMFTVEESVRIAYIPVILSELAIYYGMAALDIAKAHKLDKTKQHNRYFKTICDEYHYVAVEGKNSSTYKKLMEAVSKYMDISARDSNTLYFTVSNELLRMGIREVEKHEYEHDICVFAACSALIFQYVMRFDKAADREIGKRIKEKYGNSYNMEGSTWSVFVEIMQKIMLAIISDIMGDSKYNDIVSIITSMNKMATRILALKVEEIIAPIVNEEVKDDRLVAAFANNSNTTITLDKLLKD